MRKPIKKNLIFLFIVSLISTMVIGVSVYALNLNVTEKYTIFGKTDTFTIDNLNTYHTETKLSTFTVKKAHDPSHEITPAFDLVVYTTVDDATINIAGITKTVYKITGGFASVFSNIPIVSEVSVTLTTASTSQKIVVLGHTKLGNAYIKDFYDLKVLNNEKNYNTKKSIAIYSKIYQNIYVLDSFIIDAPITLTIPSYFNLLYADITLSADLTIKHSFGGAYSLENITGKFINDTYKININTPNALYYAVNSVLLVPANLVINSTFIDFTADTATAKSYLSLLLNDACDFMISYLPNSAYNNLNFFDYYQNFKVKMTYAVTGSSILENGAVNRATDTTANTITITATYLDPLNYVGAVSSVSKTKTISVVGTSAIAQCAYVTGELSSLITSHYTVTGNNIDNFTTKLNISGFIKEISAFAPITLSVTDINGGHFIKDNVRLSALTITNPMPFTSIYLAPSALNLSGSTLTFKAVIGTAEATLTYPLSGQEKLAVQTKFETFNESYYFASTTDIGKLYHIGVGGLYRGKETAPFAGTSFGFTGVVENKIILIPNADHTALKNMTIAQKQNELAKLIILDEVNYDSHFVYNDITHTFTIKENTAVVEGQKMIMVEKFKYSETEFYYTYTDIIIPANGIGGSDYIKYLGDEYRQYFAENKRLINSTAGENGTAKRFSANPYPGLKIRMEITTTGIDSFCKIVATPSATPNYFQIDINVDNIPPVNTTVGIKITIYTIKNNVEEEKGVLTYTFVIPGIYKVGSGKDFADTNFYNAIINYKVNNKAVYESYTNYLLIDGAKAVNRMLTFTGLTGTVDIKGINLLTNTAGYTFNNCNITTLQPFSLCNENKITELNLTNCGLTDDKTKNYLSGIKTLEKINLSNNNITTFVYGGKCIFYRALKTLIITQQTALNSVVGIDGLKEITYLDISNNNIRDFRPLIKLDTLKTVYLYGNTFANYVGLDTAKTFFGTTGEINIPVYVELLGKKVKIYKVDATTPLTAENISNENYSASLALNAVVISNKVYKTATGTFQTDLKFPTQLTSSLATYDTAINYYIVGEVVTSTITATPSGTAVDFIASITIGGVTTYKLFTTSYIS